VRIVWSPLAIDRAFEEAAFIARDKPEAAEWWLEGLSVVVDRLETFPDSGREVPELPRTKYREVICRSHRVVFAVEGKSVRILTVRRFKQKLDPSEVEGAG
jgi:plasmid stabilization system protein ParE